MSKLVDEWGTFTPMPDLVIEKWAEIGTDAMAMFLYLRNKTNRQKGHPLKGCSWPSFETMNKETGMSNRRISRALKMLEDSKLLERRKRYGRSVVYILKRPPDMAVDSISTVEGLTKKEPASISTVEGEFSHNENISISTVEGDLDLKEKDKVYKDKEDFPSTSLDQTPWVQALISIHSTHYRNDLQAFQRHWQNTEYGGHQDGKFVVICADEDQRDWLADRGKAITEHTLVGVLGKRVEVEFVIKS